MLRLCELDLIESERRMIERRIKAAKVPATQSLDSFGFKAIPSLDKALTLELARCEFVDRRENLIALTGSITIVTDYVREKKRRSREVFVPLSHPPGQAQVDFGEALGVIGGVRCKLHYFAMCLPHSDASLSCRDHRGILRRTCPGLRIFRRRAGADPV